MKLLEDLPVIRDMVFDYYSMIFEVSIANYIKMEVRDCCGLLIFTPLKPFPLSFNNRKTPRLFRKMIKIQS